MGLVTEAPYHDICYKIIGAAMDVHNRLGPGHRESVYQHSLTLRLEEIGLSCVAEQPVEIFLGDVSVGLLYVDHLVEDAVVVEEKALSHMLTNEEIAQVITYLAALDKPVGLLLNFGRRRLEYRRIFRPKKIEGWQDRIHRYLWKPPDASAPSIR
jgi:GxxExxY protein